MGLSVFAANAVLWYARNTEIALIDIALGILVYSSAVLLVNACRIQASVALIVPKFRKSTKLA